MTNSSDAQAQSYALNEILFYSSVYFILFHYFLSHVDLIFFHLPSNNFNALAFAFIVIVCCALLFWSDASDASSAKSTLLLIANSGVKKKKKLMHIIRAHMLVTVSDHTYKRMYTIHTYIKCISDRCCHNLMEIGTLRAHAYSANDVNHRDDINDYYVCKLNLLCVA